jgi:hypothetical protein
MVYFPNYYEEYMSTFGGVFSLLVFRLHILHIWYKLKRKCTNTVVGRFGVLSWVSVVWVVALVWGGENFILDNFVIYFENPSPWQVAQHTQRSPSDRVSNPFGIQNFLGRPSRCHRVFLSIGASHPRTHVAVYLQDQVHRLHTDEWPLGASLWLLAAPSNAAGAFSSLWPAIGKLLAACWWRHQTSFFKKNPTKSLDY